MERKHYDFNLQSKYKPKGDQIQAIEKLTQGVLEGKKFQTLLGATGTGKTFTISNIIKNTGKPTLVLAHNKTLAGQLYNELKSFFPENRVEYFVSYYDYYQPEAYVPSSDTYIEKDSSVNDEIDKLRHSATSSLFERDDVIIVASVSCIYGLGSPEEYQSLQIGLRVGMEISRNKIMEKLISIQYMRNDIDFSRGTFRVRGDIIEIFPASKSENSIRVEMFGDEIDRIREINSLTGEVLYELDYTTIFPASHFVAGDEKTKEAIKRIKKELDIRLEELALENKLLEAQRLEQRTNYDLEMMEEMGFCSGIENYSLHLTLREPGSTPYTLLDYFPKDWLLVVDESHVTIPQVRAMYNGDQARKNVLVDYGFRLPSALDNRPLNFSEFEDKLNQVIFVSATPADYELDQSSKIVEQIIRPTGLLDPLIEIRPVESQVFDLTKEAEKIIAKGERVLVTTLTKKMAESLTDYLVEMGLKVKYLHSDIKTLERTEIIRDLRLGKFDILIGINLLREGLDIPEVSLVAIFDADKEGFLRGDKALLQTIGRAARNENGKVIMYADEITRSMNKAIEETNRRREIQKAYNEKYGITPKTIVKEISQSISTKKEAVEEKISIEEQYSELSISEIKEKLQTMEKEMFDAAANFKFEEAAKIRDEIAEIKSSYKID
ncbi:MULTISPECIES: excinuclease ABC subunit UvrB [unclassified Gemella]|uniref:excinuclease ABC subunit UvrB n=1 Tax=unclassified Gemella TaxID=2624949 RepID=UPI0015CF8AB3|nr:MULTISPECIES: excinuclease ABC subunit UvrB [unclassified Gemella]MBF0710189.1 excinuclease ABC subunit UvrB [Gemella sp. GL1.1]NYS27533.1 excinuclease ABC subunit UvrB [Gemella sp. GL1]